MPISKNGNTYYTKEQYFRAKYENNNALEYAQKQGYPLVKTGGYYHLAEHDSMIFTPNGQWYWNSRGLQGGALDFMVAYEGKSFADAVCELARNEPTAKRIPPELPTALPEQTDAAAFVLPPKAENYKRLFGYLCGTRHLPKWIVLHMIREDALYEGVFTTQSGKEIHNAVFVYRDFDGNVTGAYARGMNPETPYKRDVQGSRKDCGWLLKGIGSNRLQRVCVFEAAIDAASPLASVPAERGADHLSLEGLNSKPLRRYLAVHPEVRQISLCLDNDTAGNDAASRLQDQLKESGYHVDIELPAAGKDWNEALCLDTTGEEEMEQ